MSDGRPSSQGVCPSLNGTHWVTGSMENIWSVTSATSPQSNELARGSPELVQHFCLHRRQNTACPIFDMVWLNRLS
jgi:hypothetical protein